MPHLKIKRIIFPNEKSRRGIPTFSLVLLFLPDTSSGPWCGETPQNPSWDGELGKEKWPFLPHSKSGYPITPQNATSERGLFTIPWVGDCSIPNPARVPHSFLEGVAVPTASGVWAREVFDHQHNGVHLLPTGRNKRQR